MAQEIATLGGGCFWCVEVVFQQLKGVEKVVSGYEGGGNANPTYEQVCTGKTGHAEVIQITFDPAIISFEQLLEVFFKTHDPTTLNQQGADRGTQYRSVIFFHSPEQEKAAREIVAGLSAANAFPVPIVTQIVPAETFYSAELYHQNYYNDNPGNGYCQAVIPQKLDKLKKYFADRLR